MAQTLEEYVADFLHSDEVVAAAKAVAGMGQGARTGVYSKIAKDRALDIAVSLSFSLQTAIWRSVSDSYRNGHGISRHAAQELIGAIDYGVRYNQADGIWVAMVWFDRAKMTRRSWLNMGDYAPEGAIDPANPGYDYDVYVPLLLDQGYNAKSYVYIHYNNGTKSGRSIKDREGAYFLLEAKRDFMEEYGDIGLYVDINDNYYAGKPGWRAANDRLLK